MLDCYCLPLTHSRAEKEDGRDILSIKFVVYCFYRLPVVDHNLRAKIHEQSSGTSSMSKWVVGWLVRALKVQLNLQPRKEDATPDAM